MDKFKQDRAYDPEQKPDLIRYFDTRHKSSLKNSVASAILCISPCRMKVGYYEFEGEDIPEDETPVFHSF